jgi:endoglucanase
MQTTFYLSRCRRALSRIFLGLISSCALADDAPPEIRVSQIGFAPSAYKSAVVPASVAAEFVVIKAGTTAVVHKGKLGAAATWEPSGESVQLADFSALQLQGQYQVRVAGLPDSARFDIAAKPYTQINQAALRYFYFNRAGMALEARYAGQFARAAGHADDRVLVHESAATATRPAGTAIASPKGWYDAGDYNKYIVNSGISTYTLLAAYEHYPEFYQAQSANIPESADRVPDLLNEAQWNLDWMLTMQDEDGGVYHKLTNKAFDGMVMPDTVKTERYVVQKSTTAALDFAATMAAASRIYRPFESAYPGFAARALQAAERAWRWAQANPAIIYKQPTDVRTGEYGDRYVQDEFSWAAAELYITTRNDDYYRALQLPTVSITVPSWADVHGLAWMSLAHHRNQLTAAADKALITRRVHDLAQGLLGQTRQSAYGVAMQSSDFVWGSNSVALNQAMMLIQAHRIAPNPEYLHAAQTLLDYALGRNPTGYSFVTGFGTKPTLYPHHRISDADGVVPPVPGMLAGGSTALQSDSKYCTKPYPSKLPAKSYLDALCSFTTNEVAINWNAPLVYVTGALQVLVP